MKKLFLLITLCFLILANSSEAAKHISCLNLPAGYACTASMKSISAGAGTAEFTDQSMSEISDAGSSGRTSFVYNWSGTLNSAKDYLVYCRCTKASNPTLAWAYWFDLTETRMDGALSDRAPASTALSNVIWTDARGGYLDKLDVTGTLANTDNASSFKADISGLSTLTAQQVWEYVTRTLTAGGLTAQQVWEYATRELTGKTGFELVAAYDNAKTCSQFNSIADEVDIGSVKGTGVTSIDDFKADISGIPTNPLLDDDARLPPTLISAQADIPAAPDNTNIGNIWNAVNSGTYGLSALKTLLDAIDTSSELQSRFDEIKGSGWTDETLKAIKEVIGSGGGGLTLEEIEASTVLAKEATVNTIAANLLRGIGLMMENHVEDDIVRNAQGLKTSSKFYLYDSSAHATTHDKVTGVIAAYTVSVSYDGSGRVTLFKVVKD